MLPLTPKIIQEYIFLSTNFHYNNIIISLIIPLPRICEYNHPLITTIEYSGSIRYLEHVVVRMTLVVEIGLRGDTQIELTSPSGTTSTILGYRPFDFKFYPPPQSSGYDPYISDYVFDLGELYKNWPFMSVMFWGEDPTGQWKLNISSRSNTSEVCASDIMFTFFGVSAVPEAVANIPTACHSDCVRGCAKAGSNYCDACSNLRNAYTLECIDVCPPGYTERNGYCYNPNLPLKECNSPLKSKPEG